MASKSGYIFKEGAKVMNWKKRFLVVERDKLAYYVKDNLKERKGEIIIRTIKEVKAVAEYKGRKFVFGIVTTTGRTFYFQGSDDENVRNWMDAINQCLVKAGGADPAAAAPQTTTNAPPPRTNMPPQRSTTEQAPQPQPPVAQTTPAYQKQYQQMYQQQQQQPAPPVRPLPP
jgi:hypothetical protein